MLVGAALLMPIAATAATKTWSGGGPNDYWQTGANWVGGVAPVPPSDGLVFTGNTRTINTNDWNSGKIFLGITFDASAAAFTLSSVSGGTVTLTGFGITNHSTNIQTVNCPLRANGSISLVADSSDLIINGPLAATSGTGTLFVQGAKNTVYNGSISLTGGVIVQCSATGMLILNNTNTYAGDTTLTSGTLALGANGTLGIGSGVSIAAGATLDLSTQEAYTLGGNASLTASGAGRNAGIDAACIIGGGLVDLGARPVALNFTPTLFLGDSNHPSLYVSGGLSLNGAISVTNKGVAPCGVGA